MLALYSVLLLLLLLAIGWLAVPFVANNRLVSSQFFIVTLFMVIFSVGLYLWTTDEPALSEWLAHGKTHYQLQEQLNTLGGLDGVIARIQAKLRANPNDAQGWFILGKLYLAKGNVAAATAAFTKAHELNPTYIIPASTNSKN